MNTAESNPRSALLQALDAQATTLDADTLDRINRDRRAALAQLHRPMRRLATGWLLGAAMAGVAAVALWPRANLDPVPPAPVSMEAFSALGTPEAGEVIESLDYYLWAGSADAAGDGEADDEQAS